MSQHTHTWRVLAALTLGLPTTENLSERFMFWACTTCPQVCEITGEVRPGVPVQTPEWWNRLAAQEQRQRTPHAQQARRQARQGGS